MVWKTPKTDWNTNPKSPMAEDFNRIEGNIAHVLNEIENKKGIIVDAVNTKRVNISIENSYAEIAAAINSINLNHRVANGSGVLEKIDSKKVRLRVTGLPFKPSKVFTRGNFIARYGTHISGGQPSPANLTYDYAFVHNAIRPERKMEVLAIEGQIGIGTVSASASITYQNDGFTLIITTNDECNIISGAGGTQYWFAEE